MAWVSVYDDSTRDCAFLTCAYSHYLRYCSDSPKVPASTQSTVTGLCQRHLLHIWKFLYALYQTESEGEEVKRVLDYVVCELNFAALTWTEEVQSLYALLNASSGLSTLFSTSRRSSRPITREKATKRSTFTFGSNSQPSKTTFRPV